MQKVEFSKAIMAEKGGVASAILILSLVLQAKALPHIPKDVLDALPEHSVAVAIGCTLGAAWNAVKFYGKKIKAAF